MADTPTDRITSAIADEIDRSSAVRPELAGWLARLSGRITSRVAERVRAAGLDVGAAVAAERASIVTYARAFGGAWREKAPDAWAAISDLADLVECGDHDAWAAISDLADLVECGDHDPGDAATDAVSDAARDSLVRKAVEAERERCLAIVAREVRESISDGATSTREILGAIRRAELAIREGV